MDGSTFIGFKECRRCGTIKPLTEFHYSGRSKDLAQSYCKVCNCAVNNTANTRARLQKWYDALSPEEKAEADKRERARSLLKAAIKRGDVERQPCAVCGDPKSHGHHDDYDKPLSVRWLCSYHHGEVHRNAERGLV